MRSYFCARCDARIDFHASRCGNCDGELGYSPEHDEFVLLEDPTPRFADQGLWRCLNSAWRCNWVLEAGTGDVWCRSCELTRGRPGTDRVDAIAAWEVAEAAKRRLVRHLLVLGLPVGIPACSDDATGPGPQPSSADEEPDGFVFDLVFLPDTPGMTGHRPGAITLDLREVDDDYRNRMRVSLGEAERTVLGHLRHEVGHHYWRVLVDAPGDHAAFRATFGDERLDYAAAIETHYRRPVVPAPHTHITHYATCHPAEDWAETFAHYLAIRDGIETADALSGCAPSGAAVFDTGPVPWLERWRVISETVNALTVGLGHPAPYPYRITEPVAAKLTYLHDRVVANAA